MTIRPPIETSRPLRTEDMTEITDQVDLQAFIFVDPEDGEKEVVLRVYKEGPFEEAGLRLGPLISKCVLKHFDEKDNIKCSEPS